MRRLTETGLKALPVVSRENVRGLHGTISLPDILAAYGAKEHPEPALSEEQSGKTLARLATRLLIAVLAVGIVASFLSYYYRSERMARGQGHFQAGQALESQGRNDEAIAQFRTALSTSHNTEQRMALGLALVNAGSLDEASIYLNEALKENPGSGPANLGLARIAVRQGKIDEAIGNYQRAIYGQWPQKTPERRLDTRLELAETLAKAGRSAQAQAELLITAAALPDDLALRQRVARMLIDYGVPDAAARLLRGDAEKEHPDSATYHLLGDAEFAMGDYAGARHDFDGALRTDPGDAAAARQTEICGKVLALDPTLAGVPSAERFRRSHELLQQILGEVVLCAKAGSGNDDAVRAAQLALAGHKRPESYSDAAEANEATARQLWAERLKWCSAPPGADDAAALVMAKLARR
jgi:tetratricopeptide (TPR) repeat protein